MATGRTPTLWSPPTAPGSARQPVAGIGWIRTAEDVVFDADGPDGYLDMVLDYCATTSGSAWPVEHRMTQH
ncbi:MAG: hypothetical protein R2717_08440 [Schumannella sp.]